LPELPLQQNNAEMKNYLYLVLALTILPLVGLDAQKIAIIEGHIYKENTNDPLGYASVKVQNTSFGTTADSNGHYRLELPPALYNLEVSMVGFFTAVQYEIQPSVSHPFTLNFQLQEKRESLETVEIIADPFRTTQESPVATLRFNAHEINRLPGATMDLSRFIKSLPGVAPKVSFGYNMIVRGGASFENKFYLDDIEIPTLTHFSVQGTSGGPNGIVNTVLLREAEFYKGAFPANRPNALSSVLDLQQRDGRKDRFGWNFTLGATDYGFVFEGPMTKKSSFIISARESYAQHMFKAIGLPVLPFYSDIQYHHKIQLDSKNEITLVGLGAYDKFLLNLDAESTESLLYNTGYIPEGKQFQYTAGIRYKHYLENSYYTVVVSRNWFRNNAYKYRNNTYLPEDQLLDYTSVEGENKFRLQHKLFKDNQEWQYGIDMEQDKVQNNNKSIYVSPLGEVQNITYNSLLNIWRYGAFVSFGNTFANGKADIFAGLRLDGNNYNTAMMNPLNQISPRFSVNWRFHPGWRTGISTGIYYQMPPYVMMGFKDENALVNQEALKYIRNAQLTASLERTTNSGYQFLAEGFYKHYDQYPFLLNDSISFANANANYVLVGNQPVSSDGKGQAYGVEFLIRQKLKKTYFWSLSYSYIVSRFTGRDGELAPSSWDNRHIASVSAGKTFKRTWQLGFRWSYSGGSPYTPYDIALSSQRAIWDVTNRGLFDYARLNTERLAAFHQLDIRLDKTFNFKRWTMSLYMDIQNAYRSPIANLPYLTLERDENLEPIIDPVDNASYLTKIIGSDTGRILPTIGMVLDF
jgi:hypothetical protein